MVLALGHPNASAPQHTSVTLNRDLCGIPEAVTLLQKRKESATLGVGQDLEDRARKQLHWREREVIITINQKR